MSRKETNIYCNFNIWLMSQMSPSRWIFNIYVRSMLHIQHITSPMPSKIRNFMLHGHVEGWLNVHLLLINWWIMDMKWKKMYSGYCRFWDMSSTFKKLYRQHYKLYIVSTSGLLKCLTFIQYFNVDFISNFNPKCSSENMEKRLL